MVLNNRSFLNTDPIRNFRFLVQFLPHSANQKFNFVPTLGFTSVSGLSVSTESVPYREGGYNAQPLSAKVLTVNGWKSMGEIEVGDRVIDPYGQDSKVTGVYPKGVRDVYKVTLRDGSETEACYQHLWEVQTDAMRTPRVIDTLELKERVERGQRVALPAVAPVEFEAIAELPIDPYLLGVLISEGSLTNGARFTQDPSNTEMLERVKAALPEGHSLASVGNDHRITVGQGGAQTLRTVPGRNLIVLALRDLGLFGKRSAEKFLPDVYKYASVADRIALLRGIMDGDGSVGAKGRLQYTSASKRLRDDVVEVIQSLGGRVTTGHVTGVLYTSPTQGTPTAAQDAYKITGGRLPFNPFHMTRKAALFVPKDDRAFRVVKSVELVRQEEVQCISVSADSHLYVTDNYIATHNTTVHQIPGQSTFGPLTLQRGMMLGTIQHWLWMKRLFAVAGTTVPGGDFRCDLMIYVLAHPSANSASSEISNGVTTSSLGKVIDDKVHQKFHVYNAWPTTVAYSDLNAGDNALMVEQLTLVHEGFDMVVANYNSSDVKNYPI